MEGVVKQRELGNLVLEDVPEEVPPHITQRLEQYQNTRGANLHDWHRSAADEAEGILMSTRFADTTQLHYISRPAGYRKQLTFFKEPVLSSSMCPNHASPHRNSVLFLRDVGGAELFQIYHFDLATAKYALLTDGVSKHGSIIWAPGGDRFAYYSTQRNGKDWDIYISDLPSSGRPTDADPKPVPEMVLSEGGSWYPVDWSHDGSKLLVKKYISANEYQVHVLHLESKALVQLNPSEDKISYGPGVFTKNGNGVFISSDETGEFQRLYYFDLSEDTLPKVLTAGIPWDIDSLDLSPNGERLLFITNEDGVSVVYVMDTATFKYIRIANAPLGMAYSARWHPNNKQIGLVFNTAQTPGDIFVLDAPSFDAEGEEVAVDLVRWTFSEVGGLDTDQFVVPSLVRFETFDQDEEDHRRTIPAFYYAPPQQQRKDKKLPVIITIHGGPEGQWRPQFVPRVQYYCCELGVAVLAPNVRGSAGYGKSFLLLDNGFKREDSVKDIGMLIQWIKQQPELDADRVMVDGGSYGGYMVLASMIHFGSQLCCGVERVGISNFVTFLENTSDYRRDNRREEYGDERIPEMRKFLLEISPTFRAHEINKPMLIAQGANDPRVPESESAQIVKQIRKPEVPVWYILAKDEGHGFKKKANIDFYLEREAMFVEQYLLGQDKH